MLSLNYRAGVAMPEYGGSVAAACLVFGEPESRIRWALSPQARLPLAQAPRAPRNGGHPAVGLPAGARMAGANQPALTAQIASTHNTTSKFELKARFAAVKDGSAGPCPAREPV